MIVSINSDQHFVEKVIQSNYYCDMESKECMINISCSNRNFINAISDEQINVIEIYIQLDNLFILSKYE